LLDREGADSGAQIKKVANNEQGGRDMPDDKKKAHDDELTDDTEERQQCILLISRVATNETSPLQDHAKQLLTRLKK